MDIRAKLALLKKEVAKVDKRHEKRKKKRKKIEISLPDFIEEETPLGVAYYRETPWILSTMHGDIKLSELLEVPQEIFSFMEQDDNLLNMDLKHTLFLDTETTGLAGGTGTVAFLIGVGFIRDDSFIIRQYFVPDYAYEPAMLYHLDKFSSDFSGMVTFNGKSYDIPLIMTRMSMNRLKWRLKDPFHLDLLHGSRRLWKKTYGSCALTSLESTVLRFYREDDIPGFLIPDMYFQYLRNKDFMPMEKVMQHNLYDIISMAALIIRVWSHLEMANAGQVCGPEFYSLGRIYEKKGEPERALEFYEKALRERLTHSFNMAVKHRVSLILKRKKDYNRLIPMWEEMAKEAELDIYAHIELAKYHEHTSKDITRAIQYIENASEIVIRKRTLVTSKTYYKEMEQLNHRKKRLKGKLEKGNMKTGKSFIISSYPSCLRGE
ncbi:MAG: ribonuclease H-like domain-containing protein [Candidatus Eremiobacteraeota bacterium]|nr:ribonuclease H-like domain-containing protein [Candidatus Eremiobacteraeota bacterium]